MSKHVHAVGIIFENEKEEILVLLRNKNRPEGNTYGLVGGKIKDGETKEETCIREIKEEINQDVKPEDLQFLKTFTWNRKDLNITFEVFRFIKNISPDIKLNSKEAVGFLWVSPPELYKREDLMLGLYDILATIYKTF